MTVAKLIECLQDMPQDAEVKSFDGEWNCFFGVAYPSVVTKDNGHCYSDRLDEEEGIVVCI